MTVAATQFACSWDLPPISSAPSAWCARRTPRGAQIILLQELFATPYFCIEQDARHLQLAAERRTTARCCAASAPWPRELGVVLPISFFERAGNVYFNSLAMFDADGRRLGIYRKSHIPERPRLSGEVLFHVPAIPAFGSGIRAMAASARAICWDQWFPESARIMALHGRRAAALSHRDRQRAAAGAASGFAAALAAHAAGPCRRQPDAAGRCNRIGTERSLHDPQRSPALLRLLVHCRCQRRAGGRGRAGRGGGHHREFRSGSASAGARQLVRVPRPAAGSVRAARQFSCTATRLQVRPVSKIYLQCEQ